MDSSNPLFADISNPKLVVIVGSLGLASNIVGLFLFHGKFVISVTYVLIDGIDAYFNHFI
jgi:hypothetical protein